MKPIKYVGILSISALIAAVTIVYFYKNETSKEDLGTFETPEEALIETHKALFLLSSNLNSGMKNVTYLEEYEKTKKTIFN